MSTKLLNLSRLACAVVVSTALGGTAILASAQAQPSSNAAVHAAQHRRHHHKRHHHSRIPQHNRGDHDSDNNGGPSDGDGAV